MQKNEFQIKLVQQIAELRRLKNISQLDFAYILDKEKQNNNMVENGRATPNSWSLHKIAVL